MHSQKLQKLFPLLIGGLLSFVASCRGSSAHDKNEIVMCTGSSITARSDGQSIRVTADGATRRRYEVSDLNVVQELRPREERWNGSLGLYSPVGSNGLHVVAEEGFQHFNSTDELEAWLSWNSERLHHVYTSDGLWVGWDVQLRPERSASGPPRALTVEVWQVFVDGAKPAGLPNSRDVDISRIRGEAVCSHPIPFVGSEPRRIDGHLYSGRAIDILKERGISADQVSRIVSKGSPREQRNLRIYYNESGEGGFSFVVVNESGDVILVG